jgi:hypothetical protein
MLVKRGIFFCEKEGTRFFSLEPGDAMKGVNRRLKGLKS